MEASFVRYSEHITQTTQLFMIYMHIYICCYISFCDRVSAWIFQIEKVLPQQKKPPTAPGSRSIFISQPYDIDVHISGLDQWKRHLSLESEAKGDEVRSHKDFHKVAPLISHVQR